MITILVLPSHTLSKVINGKKTRTPDFRTCLLFLVVLASVASTASVERCKLSRDELLSMRVEDAFNILLDYYEETCLLDFSDNDGYSMSTTLEIQTHNQSIPKDKTHGKQREQGNSLLNEIDYYKKIHQFNHNRTGDSKFAPMVSLKIDENSPSQYKLLSQLYDLLGGDNWYVKYGWMDESVLICEWHGIQCDYSCYYENYLDNTCTLIGIDLFGNNLHGDIEMVANALEQLPYLEGLDLGMNSIFGNLPDFRLPNVHHLNLYVNQIIGTIPDFQGMPIIEHIEIDGNQLEGTVPEFSGIPLTITLWVGGSDILIGTLPDFSNLPNLNLLAFYETKLKGTIPNFSGIPNVEEINLYNNQLIGTIPDFSGIPNVEEINLYNNHLSGTIPDFSGIPNVEEINLYNNHLSGTIPDFSGIPNVEEINLYNNHLSGKIPNFSGIPNAFAINIYNNQLNGTIPDFSGILNAYYIDLSNNQLNGTIPDFSGIPNAKDINLSNNQLSWTIPDFSGISDAEWILLNDNQLSGTIPDFSGILNAHHIDLSNNQLNGNIPPLGGLLKIEVLYLDDNRFTGLSEISASSLLVLSIENNAIAGTFPTFRDCPKSIKILAARNQFTKIQEISPGLLQSLDLSNNIITGSLPDFDNELLTELDLSFNNLTEPLPSWSLLKKLKRLDLYGNENLVGPLPSGMDYFTDISILSTMKTSLKVQNGAEILLPRVLQFSDSFKMDKTNDTYQCPGITNPNVGHSMVEVNSTYYNRIKCKCLPGYFGFGDNCARCHRECDCVNGISLMYCFASPNIVDVKYIIKCPRPESCITSIPENNIHLNTTIEINGLCEVGYKEHGCSKCQDGYGSQGRSCVKCESETIYSTLIIGSMGFCFFVVYLYRSKTSKSANIRIIMLHMQTLSIISSGLIQSDDGNKFIDFSSSIGSIQLPNLSCVLGVNDLFGAFLFSFARIPVFIFAGVVVCVFVSDHIKNKIIFVVLNLLFFIYYSIAREVFGVFGCTVYDDGENRWYLNYAPWIVCSPVSSEYKSLLGISVPVFLLFLVGIPVFIWRKVMKSDHKSSHESMMRYGFLYSPYKENYKFWEFIIIARRLSFSFIISVVPYTNPSVLYLLLMVIIQVSVWMQQKYQPYNSDIENQMELSSLYIIFVSFFLSLLPNLVGSQSWITIFMILLNSIWIIVSIIRAFIIPFFKNKIIVNQVQFDSVSQEVEMERIDVG